MKRALQALLSIALLSSHPILAAELEFPEPPCAGEGEAAGGSLPGARTCCPGLVYADRWKSISPSLQGLTCTQIAEMPPPPGMNGACVRCGDGKCDINHGETPCLCPEDCH